jgi:hypothetical protein
VSVKTLIADVTLLPPPARYFPIENGRYEVKPGLRRFSGNVFQIDGQFERFRQSKQSARAERLAKYHAARDLEPAAERAVNRFIVQRLAQEYPALFQPHGETLHARLTDDRLRFSPEGHFLGAKTLTAVPFASGLDALASQVQEDLAIISTRGDRHWLSAVHLCSPNHWAAEEKIGKSFASIHQPVAGMEAMNRREGDWVRTMVNAVGGLLRFAWGIATDDQLNHHPRRASGRGFDIQHPRAFLRVERQTIWGFPEAGASLFTIRTSFIDFEEIRSRVDERTALLQAIRSMSDDSLRYKGLDLFRDDLLKWLGDSTAEHRQ